MFLDMIKYHSNRDSSSDVFDFGKNLVIPTTNIVPTTSNIATTKNSIPLTTVSIVTTTLTTTSKNPIPSIVGGNYQSNLININWIGNSSFNSLNFTMSSSGMTSGNYFAFGLSNDTSMVKLKKIL